jgi:hypothetical protein
VFSFINKQYVFKQTSGVTWNFYFDDYAGLCYCNLTKRNTWTEAISLQKNILPFFCVDIDFEDYFHILFQDSKGNIFYTKLEDNINTIPVLNSKFPSTQNKHLFLLPFKNNIQLFYILPHNNSFILAQQTIHDNKVSSPVVVDYIIYNNRPFSVISDKSGNIYAFYHASDGKNTQIGFKKLTANSRKWSDFFQISRFEGNCEFTSTIIDSKDIIHACYQRFNAKQYELIYQQKISDRAIWTTEVIIHTSSQAFDNSFIVNLSNSIIIYWVREGVIYYCSSTDSGNNWSKPARYNFPSVKQLLCIYYKTNSPYEADRISGEVLPGSFINGLKLAFYQDNSNNDLSADDLKNLLIDGLKLLKGNVEDLKETSISSKDDISMLNGTLQNYEKELIKFSLKLSMIETELLQLRSNVDRLEKYIKGQGTQPGPSNNENE